jgi:hypothetical protein
MARRHRITAEEEILPVKRGLHKTPYTLYHVLWRFHEHRTGPPGYPELTRKELERLLMKTGEIFTQE